jgi:hypothetical protein
VVDYIAGMTDQYAMRMAEGLYPAEDRTKPPTTPVTPKEKKGKSPPQAKTLPLFKDEAPPP